MIRFIIVAMLIFLGIAVFLTVLGVLKMRAKIAERQVLNNSSLREDDDFNQRVAKLEQRLKELDDEVFPGEETGKQ